MNPELEKYVSEARAKGMSDESILRELVKAGWSPEDINKILPPKVLGVTPSQNIAPPSQNKGAGTRQKVLVIILCLVIVGAGLFYYRQYRQKQLRSEILSVWYGTNAQMAEAASLQQSARGACLEQKDERSCIGYLTAYVTKLQDILRQELKNSETVKEIADKNWWIIDERTKSQVEGYYDLQHSVPANKLRNAHDTLDIYSITEARKEFDDYYKSKGYEDLLRLEKL